MNRREELYRKCSNLLRAYTRSPEDMAHMWLGKYIAIRNIMKGMSESELEMDCACHEAHIRNAMKGNFANGIIGALFGAESHGVNRY